MDIRPTREDQLTFDRHGREQSGLPPVVAYATKAQALRLISEDAVKRIMTQAKKLDSEKYLELKLTKRIPASL